MSGALAYRPDASEAALMFQIKEGRFREVRGSWGGRVEL